MTNLNDSQQTIVVNESLQTVVLVDDSLANLKIGRNTLAEKYNVITVPSGAKLFEVLKKVRPDLILLDVEMPEMNGYEAIVRLKQDKDTASIPVVFLTAKNDAGSELHGLNLGAVDYIAKPFSPPILLKRVETHLLLKRYNHELQEMVDEKTAMVVDLQKTLLSTISMIVEYRDDITGHHIERTSLYLNILVNEMIRRGLYRNITDAWDLNFLFQSASLHDVGKIAIRDEILMKQGRLTDNEFETIKKHTVYGVHLIEQIEKRTTERNFLYHAKVFAGTHHERWDGRGYPIGIKGDDIPLQGRLMAIVDVYDALISKRPYKPAFTHEDAVEIIRNEGGRQFDPVLTELFLSMNESFNDIAVRKQYTA